VRPSPSKRRALRTRIDRTYDRLRECGGPPARVAREFNEVLRDLDPTYPDGHICHAVLLRRAGAFARSAAVSARALALATAELPNKLPLGDWAGDAQCQSYLLALSSVGRSAELLGRFTQAEAAYLQLLSLDPSDVGVRAELAQLYLLTDRFDEALVLLESALTPTAPHWLPVPVSAVHASRLASDDEATASRVTPPTPVFGSGPLGETAAMRLLHATAALGVGDFPRAAFALYRAALFDRRVLGLLDADILEQLDWRVAARPGTAMTLATDDEHTPPLTVRPAIVSLWFATDERAAFASVVTDHIQSLILAVTGDDSSDLPVDPTHVAPMDHAELVRLVMARAAVVEPGGDEALRAAVAPFLQAPPEMWDGLRSTLRGQVS
jgi:hypothetical protein